jgi:hypothetical protein
MKLRNENPNDVNDYFFHFCDDARLMIIKNKI